jgi:zinc transporter 1/2/3
LKRFVLRHRHESPLAHTVFSLVSCFGAGVFLATCLLHLLPEATESIEKAKDALKLDIDFPISELCFSFGFLLVLLIEQVFSF